MEKQKILIVDDDENISELISLYLMKECYDTETCATGRGAVELFKTFHPDLVLLDIMLPDIDGYEVCTEIRKTSQIPIIMLSAKGEVFDKVLGLKLGADDYLVKPFDSNELVARVKAVLRRTTPVETVAPTPAPANEGEQTEVYKQNHSGDFVEYDGLLINLTSYVVVFDGKQLDMPPKELELLYYLAKNPGRVYTREQLLDGVWGYDYYGDSRTVDVHIKRLREKLGEGHNWSISTIWGKGYKFEVH